MNYVMIKRIAFIDKRMEHLNYEFVVGNFDSIHDAIDNLYWLAVPKGCDECGFYSTAEGTFRSFYINNTAAPKWEHYFIRPENYVIGKNLHEILFDECLTCKFFNRDNGLCECETLPSARGLEECGSCPVYRGVEHERR